MIFGKGNYMQVNGIKSYSTPHVTFGNNDSTEKKQINKKALIAAGAGAAAIAVGTIYSVKRGKKINTAGLTKELIKQDDSLKGLKGLWGNLKTGVVSIFTKTGRKEYKYSKSVAKSINVLEAASENKLTQEMTERLTQNAAKSKAVRQIKTGRVALASLYDDAGNRLTGEALENAKKLRKAEFAKAVEEAKKTLTEEDIAQQAISEAFHPATKLGLLRAAKSMLDEIKKGNTPDAQTIEEFFNGTNLVNKIINDDKVDMETLKFILEKLI